MDGAPDTGGNVQGPPVSTPAERPQRSAPPPPSGEFNPSPLPPTAPAAPAAPAAPPAPTPELEPNNPAPNRPPDRRVAPAPIPTPERAIAPDGSPTGNPAPDATPDNVPVGGTATLPSGTTVTKTATGYEVSVPMGDPRPLVSPRPVKTPDGETINPGETVTEEKKAGGLPWWLTAPPLVAKVPQGTKVNATDPSSFVNPEPPKTPPPSQPPTDNPCRCNAPINNRLDKLDEKLTKALGGVSAAGDAGVLTYLRTMQNYAEKAWKSTQLQKAINALTLVTTLHNAYYLSRDVGATLGEMISLLLDTVGIDDEAGNPLDINAMVGKKVKAAINAALGEKLATNIGNSLTKASRIYQSASNVIWSIRNITDSTTDLLELTANNTGKIGNSLRESKVVDALTMPRFSENHRAGDATRRKTQRILDGIEQVDDTVGTLYAAVATVRDVQEEVQAAGQAKAKLIEELGTLPPRTDVPENQPVATASSAAAEASQAPNAQPVDLEPANATP
ncbi:hypothetical protein [Nodosilinea sp. FACHB-13]|uniref:hypothetical protein n=1 Tax=Cyanophyceae TaxID=3028117 RepID=UPI00168563B4|nr:hypothetical protein [Nodosilinea sp. FACHB-13]MBD2107430.1 hypothetical protein [Nodosilinea sp. FACHB-13]